MTATLLLIMIVAFGLQFGCFFVAASWFIKCKNVFDRVLEAASDCADAAPELPVDDSFAHSVFLQIIEKSVAESVAQGIDPSLARKNAITELHEVLSNVR